MAANVLQSAYEKKLEAGLKRLVFIMSVVRKDKQTKAEAMPDADVSQYIGSGVIDWFTDSYKQGSIQGRVDEIEAIIDDSFLDPEDTLKISTDVFNRHMTEIGKRMGELTLRMSKPNVARKTQRRIEIEMFFCAWHLSIIRDRLMKKLEESYGE